MKKFILLVFIISTMLSATFVDVNTAKVAAKNYYQNFAEVGDKGNEIKNIVSHKYEGEVTWYAINFDNGFVIINAEDVLRPILGYSYEGQVPDADREGGFAFKEWFGYYDKQIKAARESSYIDANAQTEWKNIINNKFSKSSKSIAVDALVKSKWSQGYPWDEQCPESSGLSTMVGCVATSMSQILNYHQWPDTGVGSHSYVWRDTTLAESFVTPFDYSLMPDIIEREYGLYPESWETINMTQTEIDMMSKLCHLTGISVEMNYGLLGSGAMDNEVDDAFRDHWKASSSVITFMGTPINPDQYATEIKVELDAKRPWYWSGGIHAFIMDGYTDDYWYHFNWGWAGSADGWFQIHSLKASDDPDDDFTADQIRISYVPNGGPFANWEIPQNFVGNLTNNDDVSLTWSAPAGGNQDSYNVYRSIDGADAVLMTNTTTPSYAEYDGAEGEYSYYITAIYGVNESHNTDSYSASIAPSANFPLARGLAIETVGRTSIDLTWLPPFTGVINYSVDFEDGIIPADWIRKLSVDLSKNDTKAKEFWYDDTYPDILITSKTEAPHIVYRGEYAVKFMTNAEKHMWLFSPEFTFSTDTFVKFWTRFKGLTEPAPGKYPRFHVVVYEGDFTEGRDPLVNYIATYDANPASPDYHVWNDWESEWNVPITGFDGLTKRVGFMVELTVPANHYTFALDDILIGSESGGVSGEPSGIAVYRDEVLISTEAGTATSYSDTGFIDGENTYYIKALYPTGESLATSWLTVNMDADPKPDFLSGILNGSNDVELSWYVPYHNPSKWYTYITPEECTSVVDSLATPIVKRRTIFKAEDLGYYYPITLDSVGIGFYDRDEGNWGGNNTFIIRILTGGINAYDDTVYTSPTLTAVSGEIFTHALSVPMVLSESWNVEVTTVSANGDPGTLAAQTTNRTHSYYYNEAQSHYGYAMQSGATLLYYEWLHMSYLTSSAPPPIAKNGWVTPGEVLPTKSYLINNVDMVKGTIQSSKGIDEYNIYRNGSVLGTSTTINYTDLNPLPGDNTYHVTANYANPIGESDGSNEIIVNTPDDGLNMPANLVTSILGTNLILDWDVVVDATGYDVYSSDDPYGMFTLTTSVGTNQFTVSTDQSKLFYYIIATNAAK